MNELIHFKVHELVPASIYQESGDVSIQYLTDEIITSIEHIHSFFEVYYPNNMSVVINNYFWGGKYQYRGYRPPECTEGAEHSEHRSGNAVDFDVYYKKTRIDPRNIRRLIICHRDQFPLITRMEDNVNWVHIDCKKVTDKTNILLFTQ